MLSTSYNLSKCYLWDRKNKTIKWEFGDGPDYKISYPHDPHMLPNGNIMLFDNGRYYSGDLEDKYCTSAPDSSRIVEIDYDTKKIIWSYKAENPVDFYSTFISSCQRLPNGNTFICEGAIGRLFEVDDRGQIVWEYLSPFYSHGANRFGRCDTVFRATRIAVDDPALNGKVFDDAAEDHLNRIFGSKALLFQSRL